MKIEIMLRSLNRFTNCVIVADKFFCLEFLKVPFVELNELYKKVNSLTSVFVD